MAFRPFHKPRIFLSYRRADSAAFTLRLYDHLIAAFGKDHVFVDLDAIPPGVDFREHILSELQRCDVLLAIIGPKWLGPVHNGPPRIMSPDDNLRIEVETALGQGIPVVPVLIDGTPMPNRESLPESLGSLLFRNAARIDSLGRDFHVHTNRLIADLRRVAPRRSNAGKVVVHQHRFLPGVLQWFPRNKGMFIFAWAALGLLSGLLGTAGILLFQRGYDTLSSWPLSLLFVGLPVGICTTYLTSSWHGQQTLRWQPGWCLVLLTSMATAAYLLQRELSLDIIWSKTYGAPWSLLSSGVLGSLGIGIPFLAVQRDRSHWKSLMVFSLFAGPLGLLFLIGIGRLGEGLFSFDYSRLLNVVAYPVWQSVLFSSLAGWWVWKRSGHQVSQDRNAPAPRSQIVLRCVGWKPPSNHAEQIVMLESSRMRFELTRIAPRQNYVFYFRFWSEGRAPRWIGITNIPGTNFFSKNGDEVTLTETTNARPNTDIRVLELIRARFPDFDGTSAVIDRLRLRGDAVLLVEIEASVTII